MSLDRAPGTPAQRQPGTPADAPTNAGARVSLLWAGTEFFVGGQSDGVVELRVILDNPGPTHTNSTSIHWEPAFNRRFTFLRSEPDAWRVRTDERGWGVLDTAGVLPRQYGTFQLWFVAREYGVLEPRIVVTANTGLAVGETLAAATDRVRDQPTSAQQAFERGAVAWAADAVPFVPAGGPAALWLALTVSLLLIAAAGAGSAAALRAADMRPAMPRLDASPPQ